MKKLKFELLIPGIPYKTKYGGIGYSSVSLIKDGNDVILFDVGHYAVRGEIIKILQKYKINKVFLSHLHYDHCLNIDLFLNREIKIYLNKKEWFYLDNIRSSDIFTFKFFNKIIKKNEIILFDKEFNISENVLVLETIGHTPGHSSLSFVKNNKKCIIAGDAIKTFRDFNDKKYYDLKPYNLKDFLATKKYIVDNFDIIIPGHSDIIKNGKFKEKKVLLKNL